MLFVMLASACTDTALLDNSVAISDRKWHYEDQPEIEAHITDTKKRYNIYLNLRHTPDYKYSNIFVLVHRHEPNGRDTTERFEVRLAEPDGRWLGRGMGSTFSHQQLLKEHFRFPDTGKYVFKLEQNMRENPLDEITDVGIRIAPVE
ncbi:gliding motility lipoprotein GldH [Parapedobacter tibetensis]|uniref:gliding motility lipoprotein GldH n=1 Tax=Parapedobacter tibetensis TaxID=2972951 RepID=UPI00214D2DAA|nr:gliding motility lipoprotein GldH [Parapedobacter tibetensis]